MILFTAIKLSKEFLLADPETRDSHDDYKAAKEKVAALRIVKDSVERAVKLAIDFNFALTHNEEQSSVSLILKLKPSTKHGSAAEKELCRQ